MASEIFAGTSRYSGDFGAVIERSVGIASLALTQMQQGRQKSNNEITALGNLETVIQTLQGKIADLENSVGTRSLQATSSHSTTVSATASEGAAEGSYRMTVVSLGAFSTVVGQTADRPAVTDATAAGWTNASKLTLRITDQSTGNDPTEIEIDLAGESSLQAVVNAINAKAGYSVQAAIVNIGESTPNYTITLQSAKLGKLSFELKEGNPPPETDPVELLNSTVVGSKAEYKINGTTVYSDSRSVTLAPKLTADLLKADAAQEVQIDVKRTTASVTTALTAFITTYNTVVDEIDKMTASNGALKGSTLASTVRNQLRSAIAQTFAGQFTTLAQVGVEFEKDGKLKLNTQLFNDETKGKFDALKTLIGTTKGSGVARALTDAFDTITNTTETGFLDRSIDTLKTSLTAEDKRIEAETKRVEDFTRDLQERMAKADAMIAQLEQQASYFNNMFEAMRANQKSYS